MSVSTGQHAQAPQNHTVPRAPTLIGCADDRKLPDLAHDKPRQPEPTRPKAALFSCAVILLIVMCQAEVRHSRAERGHPNISAIGASPRE
jgi:hypothetical protein